MLSPFRIFFWRVFLPFAAGYFLSYLYRTLNAVLSPYLTKELQLDATALGLLTSVYFLTFALSQLPLGVVLDRWGPRRVEAFLLFFAAAGAVLCAVSDQATELLVGRALIGLGVSACLMAGFKAFALWMPAQRLPAVNGWILAAGGLGAIAATAPIEAVLYWLSWRSVFLILAGLTGGIALWLWLSVPERRLGQPGACWRDQWRGVGAIFRSPMFWRVAPAAVSSQGTFLAIQGLWAGPWLHDVVGLDRTAAAEVLLWVAAAMTAGFLGLGQLTYRLTALRLSPLGIVSSSLGLFMGTQFMLWMDWIPLPLGWLLFGFFGTSGTLSYALLPQLFPPAAAGRVNTALNLLVFVAAFIGQWGMGVLISRWPATQGGYAAIGYFWAFGLALVLQVVTWAWLLGGLRHFPHSDDKG